MKRTNEDQHEFRKVDSGPKYLFRGPKIDWGLMVLRPGEEMGYHIHTETEETFYFFDGAPKMIVNDIEYQTRIGDAFYIEPHEKHNILNDTSEPIKCIFIKTPYLPDDKINC
ncbi:MAG: cupin domain-containing protein [bacterium]